MDRFNKIPHKVKLLARGTQIDVQMCSLCVGAEEVADHLIFSCPFAYKVWEEPAAWCGINLDGVLGV